MTIPPTVRAAIYYYFSIYFILFSFIFNFLRTMTIGATT